MLDQIEAALSLLDRLKKWWRDRKNTPVESLASRFVRLFESHGLHRNQIHRFFSHGLTLKDVQDDASLLEKLDERILEDVCAKFAVRREWLDGADEQVYEIHDSYPVPEHFAEFIATLKANNSAGQLNGYLLVLNKAHRDSDALLILSEVVGQLGDTAIRRYHLCQYPSFGYWKSRAYLTACIAIAWKNGIYVKGLRMSNSKVQRMFHGTSLPFWFVDGLWSAGGKKWYPEDMALVPETYLEGIDPEQDKFGIKSALDLWLQLEAQGLMDTGLDKDVRPLFVAALEKLK
ncbi:MAG: hypothetical protein RBS05_17785 [Zoogloea oleivorans]|uniref:hypothetical protein n=1 Tax=Zoogloea oleivorans TaxID=1552750 RepID=UPI002A36C6E1|nr:hypothetical protein [Zoogloea oleivorans]MDY0037766.1 hypothetical protein [Zoogloea oleivorans]